MPVFSPGCVRELFPLKSRALTPLVRRGCPQLQVGFPCLGLGCSMHSLMLVFDACWPSTGWERRVCRSGEPGEKPWCFQILLLRECPKANPCSSKPSPVAPRTPGFPLKPVSEVWRGWLRLCLSRSPLLQASESNRTSHVLGECPFRGRRCPFRGRRNVPRERKELNQDHTTWGIPRNLWSSLKRSRRKS